MVKYYVVHKCPETECSYKSDREPCNSGIYVENEKSEKLWDTKIKFIAEGHSSCRSRVFPTEAKYEKFLKTKCVKCNELIDTGVSRKSSKATNSEIPKPNDFPCVSVKKFAELAVGEFENKSQSCPESENEETDSSVKPCRKRARSPDTTISNKKVKIENDDVQVWNNSPSGGFPDWENRFSLSNRETDGSSGEDKVTSYSIDSSNDSVYRLNWTSEAEYGFEKESEDDDVEQEEETGEEEQKTDEDSTEPLIYHTAENQSPSKYWFSLRANPAKKPSRKIHIPKNSTNQTINDFFIQENLIGEYELSYIELKPDGFQAELVSMENCIVELHQNTYTIVRDFCAFGEYKCEHCKRNWKSANSYVSDGMKCLRGCSDDLVYAYKRTVKGGPGSGDVFGEHREDLCGRCRRLGYRCR